MKSKHLHKRIRQLRYISEIRDPKLRRRVLSDLSDDEPLYKALAELASCCVHGRIHLTPAQKRRLRPHRRLLLGLAKPTKVKAKRRRLVIQSGGLLPLVLLPLIGALAKAAALGAAGAAGGLAVKKILDK